MPSFSDLFQWERFITPSIIKGFYLLVIGLVVLAGLSAIFSALVMMAVNFFAGLATLIGALLFVVVGVIFARIASEFILIVFRINEHLGAIRDRAEM